MSAGPHVVREALLAQPYGLGTVILQAVLPDGSIAILSDGLSYLLALRWIWMILQVLSEAVVRQQQNSAC
jgi:hypothetical protein